MPKCFFETYRFSEDLDFTILNDHVLSKSFLETHLETLAKWIEEQLAHQIHELPGVDSFLADLKDAIIWWLEPAQSAPKLASMPGAVGRIATRSSYADFPWLNSPSPMDRIRHAARSRMAAVVEYKGSKRLVEPFSLRFPVMGNELLLQRATN